MARFAFLAMAFATLLSPISAHLAHSANDPRAAGKGCGTVPSAAFLASAAEMAKVEANATYHAAMNLKTDAGYSAAATITIQTYFHVIAKSTALSGGYITSTMLTNQLAVMNSNYAAYGIQFALAGTDYTINTSWASDGAELAMKKALRKGTYKDLNLYFQFAIGGNLGVCFPLSTLPIFKVIEILLIEK